MVNQCSIKFWIINCSFHDQCLLCQNQKNKASHVSFTYETHSKKTTILELTIVIPAILELTPMTRWDVCTKNQTGRHCDDTLHIIKKMIQSYKWSFRVEENFLRTIFATGPSTTTCVSIPKPGVRNLHHDIPSYTQLSEKGYSQPPLITNSVIAHAL
jgi:hypothetical protein